MIQLERSEAQMQSLGTINREVQKAIKNTNYSQWERRGTNVNRKALSDDNVQSQVSMVSVAPKSSKLSMEQQPDERKCSSYCNHSSHTVHPNKMAFKSTKQLKDEEDKRNILKVRIKYAKEHLEQVRQREEQLIEQNRSLLAAIEAKETTTNQQVDGILRKYEKYHEVIKTIEKKHGEEVAAARADLDRLRREIDIELPKYEASSNKMEQDLREARELANFLSIYKNQEYPEKLLQINHLRKTLADLNSLNLEEVENLSDIITKDKHLMKRETIEATRSITDKVTDKALGEMHWSLKDMAKYNDSLRKDIDFYKFLEEKLHKDISEVHAEVKNLRIEKNKHRDPKKYIFSDVFKENTQICTPDMDIVLNLTQRDAKNNKVS